MSNFVAKIFEIAFVACIVTGIIYFIFMASYTDGTNGITASVGSVAQNIKDAPSEVNVVADDAYQIEMEYQGRRVYLNDTVCLPDFYEIKTEGSSAFVNGSLENGFQMYLRDVQKKDGSSVLTYVDNFTDGMAGDPFEYCEETQQFRCGAEGVYKLDVEFYDSNGNQKKETLTVLAIAQEQMN